MSGGTGPRRGGWRSLDEMAEDPALLARVRDEFPAAAAEWTDDVSRRRFLSLMGASLALAGITGCTKQPKEEIAPYAQAPESLVPGRPVHYATSLTLGGYATGVLVETHEGRPTRIEGNPDHPASLGAIDPLTQAAILGLYDPDRSHTTTFLGEIRPWSDLVESLKPILEAQSAARGAGLRILTETVTSPSLAARIREVLARFPEARWHQYEPASRRHTRAGSRLAFGEPLEVRYDLSAASVIVCLDADFMSAGPGCLPYIRSFAAGRRAGAAGGEMNRL